jgi:hypothetical protein
MKKFGIIAVARYARSPADHRRAAAERERKGDPTRCSTPPRGTSLPQWRIDLGGVPPRAPK